MFLRKFLPILKSNLCHRVGLAKLIFHVLCTNIVVFDKAPWESPARTNLFQKLKKELASSTYSQQLKLRTHPGPFQFMIEDVFGLMYLMMPSVGAQGNGHKSTCTKNLLSLC